MGGFKFRIQTVEGSGIPSVARMIPSTLFGLVFMGFAVAMGFMVLKGFQQDQAILAWEPVECSIVRSSIGTVGEGKYSFTAEYQYERSGFTYTGCRYSRESGDYTFEKVSEKTPLLKRYPIGIVATCYVNPANPADSVLTRGDGDFPLGMFLFLVPFVLVGFGVAIGPWIARARKQRATGFTSLTQDRVGAKRTSRIIPMLFGFVFAAAGVAVGFQSFSSLGQYRAASAWVEVPAVVTASAVRSHRGDDSTTYRPYIAYAYTVDGQSYEGDRYDFWGVSSSGYDGKAAIVREHPVGREIRIFVDPVNPVESVINRQAGWGILFPTFFPLIFIVVGVGVFVAGVEWVGRPRPEVHPASRLRARRRDRGGVRRFRRLAKGD